MMFRVALCVLALASAASANYTANVFIDQVLRDMFGQVKQNGLDPVRVMPFQIKVKSSSITNRDLKANFTQGSIFGLASLVRQGDCSYGTYQGQMKMGCYVALQPVRIMMNADVKGDAISGNKHAIATSSTVAPNTFALLEIVGRRFSRPIVDRLSVNAVTMTLQVVQGKLDLNNTRLKDFTAQTHQNLSNQLVATLSGTYKAALNTVLSRRTMP